MALPVWLVRPVPMITRSRPTVATISETNRPEPLRTLVETSIAEISNITLASMQPRHAPITWADPAREAAFNQWLAGLAPAHGLQPHTLAPASAALVMVGGLGFSLLDVLE